MNTTNTTATVQGFLPALQNNVKLFLVLLFISACAMLFQFVALGPKRLLFPGDYYQIKGARRIYIPFGGTIILTVGLFFLITTKLGLIAFSLIAFFIFYKVVIKRKF